jgi:molecular chaperone HscC
VAVDVRYTFDASGILEVQVSVPLTLEVKHLVLQRGAQHFSAAEVAQRLQALAALKVHPREQQVNQALLARAHRLHEELLGRPRSALVDAIVYFEGALQSQDEARIAPARTVLQQVLASLGLNELL